MNDVPMIAGHVLEDLLVDSFVRFEESFGIHMVFGRNYFCEDVEASFPALRASLFNVTLAILDDAFVV
jgi:hypothetical protein